MESNLKTIRTERGLAQSQLAELSGVSIRMIQHYEQGFKDIRKAQVTTVIALADALGVNVKELV